MNQHRIVYIILWLTICLAGLVFTPAKAEFGDVLGDIQYERVGGGPQELKDYPPSIFQHWVHRIRFRCDACHDTLFDMELGGPPLTHKIMKQGKGCRVCHNGKIAFDAGFENCHRCHVPEQQ